MENEKETANEKTSTEKKTDEKASIEKNVGNKVKGLFNNLEDSTSNFEKKDIESGKAMGVLSYIIPLIPFFA